MAATFVVDMPKIEAWKAKMADSLDSAAKRTGITVPDLSDESRSPRERLLGLGTAIMIPAAIGGLFIVLPVVRNISGGGPLWILALIVSLGVVGGLLRVAWKGLSLGVSRASEDEKLWKVGLREAESQPGLATYCLAKALSYPYQKRLAPRWANTADGIIACVRTWKDKETVDAQLLQSLKELLFVEIWLDLAFNSGSALSGVAPEACLRNLRRLGDSSAGLLEFRATLRSMADDEQHPVIAKLDTLLGIGGDDAAKQEGASI
jgi:hypothetical protein